MEIKRNSKAPANNRGWSTSDDSTLIKMARGGASGAEIAKILGRTIMAVTTRKHTLHVDVRLKSSKGSTLDVPKSVSVKSKKKRKELAPKIISRTPASQPVDVNVTQEKTAKQAWKKEHDTELLKLSENGNSVKLIAKILDRTVAAVAIRKSFLKKLANINKQKDNIKADEKKSAMLLRMEKMRNAKGKSKKTQAVENAAPIQVPEKADSIKIATEEPAIQESDFAALSRIAKSTGATITVVFNK